MWIWCQLICNLYASSNVVVLMNKSNVNPQNVQELISSVEPFIWSPAFKLRNDARLTLNWLINEHSDQERKSDTWEHEATNTERFRSLAVHPKNIMTSTLGFISKIIYKRYILLTSTFFKKKSGAPWKILWSRELSLVLNSRAQSFAIEYLWALEPTTIFFVGPERKLVKFGRPYLQIGCRPLL